MSIRQVGRRVRLNPWRPATFTRSLYGVARDVPVLEKCPDAYCECAPMPDGLDIDRKTPLEGTMAAYDMHIVVETPDRNWPSRFEDGDTLAARVKNAFGRKGKLYNPNFNVLVTAYRAARAENEGKSHGRTPFWVFPGFYDASTTPTWQCDGFNDEANTNAALQAPYGTDAELHDFLKTQVLPRGYFTSAGVALPATFADSTPHRLAQIRRPVVLICGHDARDSRCGILGPLLEHGFRRAFADAGVDHATGQITHIGGHKYAGNVIVYVPPAYAFFGNALAGMGVWYGRVEPRHVPGIVEETIGRGRIVHELFRGAVGPSPKDLGARGRVGLGQTRS